jgi:hypothetical protein
MRKDLSLVYYKKAPKVSLIKLSLLYSNMPLSENKVTGSQLKSQKLLLYMFVGTFSFTLQVT